MAIWQRNTRLTILLVALLLLILTLLFLQGAWSPAHGQIIGGVDVRAQFFPWWQLAREALRQGALPLWDPYQFSGYPFYINPQLGLFYPPAWAAIILPARLGITIYVWFHLWLAGMGMFLLTRRLSGSDAGALLAALTYSFSGFMGARLQAGHITMIATAAWIPWVLLAYHRAVAQGDSRAAATVALAVGMAILSGNTNMLFYLVLIWFAFAIYLAAQQGAWRMAARQMLIGGAGGMLLSAVQTLPLLEFLSLSTRASGTLEAFGTRWSLPPFHLLALIIPTYFGVPEITGWWSVENFEELTYYVGALPLLALAVSLRRPTRLTWLYAGLIIFGLLMALGTYGPLYPILYRLLPPFRLGRAPARAAFLFVFASSALLAETLAAHRTGEHLRRRALDALMRAMIAVIVVGGVLGLTITGAAFTALHPSDTGGRLWHQAGGWMWALLAFTGGAVLLWQYLRAGGTRARPRGALAGAMCALVVADLWLFSLQLVRLQDAGPAPFWTAAHEIIGETRQRVVPWAATLTIQNDAELTHLYSVLGYNPLDLEAYDQFALHEGDPRSTAFDILSVAYILSPSPLESRFLEGENALTLLRATDAVHVYQRARVLPMARLVYRVEVISDAAAARARVHQADFDPTDTVILAEPAPAEAGPATAGSAEIVAARPGYWATRTKSASPALLVLSENAYPGWRVTVDGQPADALTAYTVVRAVCIPAGNHLVEWHFSPTILRWGAGISLLTLALLAVAAIRRHSPRH